MSYGRRNRWKKGDWLVVDQESGITTYASKVKEDWQGLYVRKRYADPEQPQDFVRPADDPIPVPYTSLPVSDFDACLVMPYYIGRTTVRSPQNGPATHLFQLGIGEAEIGCTFIVY